MNAPLSKPPLRMPRREYRRRVEARTGAATTGAGTDTRVLADGAIRLGPPGLEVAIAVSYPED
ncbi:MAG: hypothetical protein ICV73_06925 [Acetobacteraceae bacterium]|nr:hypothetical protein [Acetobacteraceae bacterium]